MQYHDLILHPVAKKKTKKRNKRFVYKTSAFVAKFSWLL